MPGRRPPDPCRTHDAAVLVRWIAPRDSATRGEAVSRFAARLGEARVDRALDVLRAGAEVAFEGGRYHVTIAGRERAATPLPRLPVLPDPITPRAGFYCQRIGVALHVEVCAERHRVRTDEACARDAEGAVVPGGCPVGAEAARRLAEYHEAAQAAKLAARRARRAAA